MTKKITKTKAEKRKPLDKLLKIITKECENKGWYWKIDALDEKEFRSATILVEKNISSQDRGRKRGQGLTLDKLFWGKVSGLHFTLLRVVKNVHF